MSKIIIASRNRGKIAEIKGILTFPGVEFDDLHTLGFDEEIKENGATFRENALIKAERVFSRYCVPVVSDDSGLCVPALGGRPGVLSSRFAGPNATDEENNALLLKLLHGFADDRRRAFFFCTALFYYDEGKYCCAEGRIDGVITREPAGESGFGYDPVFRVLELGKTLAQVPAATKNGISHRAQAFRALRELIESCLC